MARTTVTIEGYGKVAAEVTTGRERPPTARPGTYAVHTCLGARKGYSVTHLPSGRHVLATRLQGTAKAFARELEDTEPGDLPEVVRALQARALAEKI